MNAAIRNEIFCAMPTRIGALADVTRALADAGVDIEGIGAYDKDGRGEFMLVVSDNAAGASALRAIGAEVTEKPVILVEVDNTAGALAEIAEKVAAADINVSWVYASAAGPRATIVLRTSDNERAVELLG